MKQKKYKRCELTMQNVYGKGFGMRPPYHFLVDASFCVAALRHKFDIRGRMATIFEAPVRMFTTSCVMSELKRAAQEESTKDNPDHIITGATFVARRLELRRCVQHTPPKQTSCDCILDIIKNSKQPFGVATGEQKDDRLKRAARLIPGTPLVYVERTFPLLESPSEVTRQALQKKQSQQQKLDPVEAQIIKKRLLPSVELNSETLPKKKHKRKHIKGPNPLSVKKAKKVDHNRGMEEAAPPIVMRKRKRSRKSCKPNDI